MKMIRTTALAWVSLLALICANHAGAQQTCTPRMEQDPDRNNLVHDPDYETVAPGTLGGVVRSGHGPLPMVLIAGGGFGAEVFAEFMDAHADRFTMWAVTLPGYGGTPAPPMPPQGTSYGEQSWTRSARDAVARLIDDEGIDRPIVLGHWLTASQVAIDLAVQRPELVRAAIVVSGVPKFVPVGSGGIPELTTQQQRAQMVDHYLAPQWFKTVTRETWDDNNYLPRDYAIHPLRGLQLWQRAAEPELPVSIRYLCERWAHDSTLDLDALEVPLLVIKPEFDSLYYEGPQAGAGDYMQAFLHTAWEGVEARSDRITVETIADSRVFIMDDQPAKLSETIERFLQGAGAAGRRPANPRLAERDPSERSARDAGDAGDARDPGEAPGSGTPEEEQTDGSPDYWGGAVTLDGHRYTLSDAGLVLSRPDASWTLEASTDDPPVVATLQAGEGDQSITIQVQPVFGMSLDALAPLIEQRIAGTYGAYERRSLDSTKLAGLSALRLEADWEQDGVTTRGVLLFATLEDGHLLSMTTRGTPEQFAARVAVFEQVATSVLLSR